MWYRLLQDCIMAPKNWTTKIVKRDIMSQQKMEIICLKKRSNIAQQKKQKLF